MKRLLFSILCLVYLVALGQSNRFVRSVGSLDDLVNFTDPFTQVVAVQYGSALEDGNGGVFYRDTTSTTATNALNILAPATLTGRWIRTDLSVLGGSGNYTAQEILFGDGTSTPVTDPQLLFNTTGNVLTGGEIIRILDDDASNWVALQAPSVVGSDVTLTLPDNDGDANDVLLSDGSGVLSWSAFTDGGVLLGDSVGGIQQDTLLSYDTASDILDVGKGLRLDDTDTSNTITVDIPDISVNHTITLPSTDGTANQNLITDGSGNWGWADDGAAAGFDGGDLADTLALHAVFNFLDTDYDFQAGGTHMVSSNSFAGWFGKSTQYTNILAPHTISTYINMVNHDGSQQNLMGQFSANEEWELAIDASRNLAFKIGDSANGGTLTWTGDTVLSSNQWYHVGITWDYVSPIGTNGWADRIFETSVATNAVRMYVNGVSNVVSLATSGTFGAMVNSAADPMAIGDNQETATGGDFDGYMGPVEIYNRRFWVEEMERMGRRNTIDVFTAKGTADVPGAEVYDSDFTSTTDGWTASGPTLTASYDSTDTGFDETLRIEANATTSSDITQVFTLEVGKLYAWTFNFKVVSGSDVQFAIDDGGEFEEGSIVRNLQSTVALKNEVFNAASYGEWTRREYYFVADSTSTTFYVWCNRTSGAATDELLIQDMQIYEVGRQIAISPFRTSEIASQVTDISGNNFDFVRLPFTAGTTTTPTYPMVANPNRSPFHSGTWTPTLAYNNDSTGFVYDSRNGYYTLIGDVCYIQCQVDLNTDGSGTGTFEVRGLPFPPRTHAMTGDPGAAFAVGGFNWVTDSPAAGYIRHQSSTDYYIRLILEDTGSTAQDTNIQNSTVFYMSGFYFVR